MDYTLLRPFDLEAAKRGEPVCGAYGLAVRWVGVGGNGQRSIIELGDDDLKFLEYARADALRMAPLCWVEGRPVYTGDVLYVKVPEPRTGSVVTAEFPQDDDTISTFRSENGAVPKIRHDQLTWTPPKVKREIKLLAFIDGGGGLRWVREDYWSDAPYTRVPSEDKTVEVEEPNDQEGV